MKYLLAMVLVLGILCYFFYALYQNAKQEIKELKLEVVLRDKHIGALQERETRHAESKKQADEKIKKADMVSPDWSNTNLPDDGFKLLLEVRIYRGPDGLPRTY